MNDPDLTLFDATPFGPARTPRKQPIPGEPWPTVELAATKAWRGVARKTGGIVHALHPKRSPLGGVVSWCGLLVVPHTFINGEVVRACRQCLDRGAPRPPRNS